MSPAGVSRLARAPASAGAACCGQAAAGPYAARQRWGRALGGTGLECQELGYAIQANIFLRDNPKDWAHGEG